MKVYAIYYDETIHCIHKSKKKCKAMVEDLNNKYNAFNYYITDYETKYKMKEYEVIK